MPENQTVWKSDNQGVKETNIQTGRRGSDGKPGQQGHVKVAAGEPGQVRQKMADWDTTHSPGN